MVSFKYTHHSSYENGVFDLGSSSLFVTREPKVFEGLRDFDTGSVDLVLGFIKRIFPIEKAPCRIGYRNGLLMGGGKLCQDR